MYRFLLTLSIQYFLLNPVFGQLKKTSEYASPLKAPLAFSGGFGELRRNHFHTGLDFRTGGQVGSPVFAVKEGFVARVSVSPYGYGHALYLMHPDGHTTVNGHLSRFHPKIEEYVVSQQYRLKQFKVDLTIPEGLISFKKGEIVAWSGNSGSSGGPHLHFEIRDTKSEKTRNPLFYLSSIPDKSSPRINSIYLYPLSQKSYVNRRDQKFRIETISANKSASLRNQSPIEVFGDIGIGIQSDDDFNGTGIKCGIYSAELFIDQEPVFSFKMDNLSFDQGRYVNSHLDFEELIRNNRWIHRLYLQPGNKMDIYQNTENRGILKLEDGKIHTVKIVVADAFKNENVLTFKLVSKQFSRPATKLNFTKSFYFDRSNDFETSDLKLHIPEGALYDQLNFDYHSFTKTGDFHSKIHQIHNQFVPVHKSYDLSLKTQNIPKRLQNKALIVLVTSGGNLSSLGGEFTDGWLTAHPRVLGDFTVVLDTIPPTIRPLSIKENKILMNKVKIEFKISDNLSGIEWYEGTIDGSWVLFEFDGKTETLSYTFDKTRLILGKEHTLILKVGDERKNIAEYKANFYL